MHAPIDPLDATATSHPGSPAPISPTDRTLAPAVLPEPSPPLGITGQIGRYILRERLGEGGMGVVYAAHDPTLDRKVALKLIHTVRRDDRERRLRMEREARAMARLSHPNVVTVHEVGEVDGRLFLVMEFVQGRDLHAWLRDHDPSNWRATLAVFLQAGHGLAAAHLAGLVHRDFKPENVFVGDDGRVRVGDFGLARHRGDTLDPAVTHARTLEDLERSRDLTVTGALLGTPAYMAPEQFRGGPTDHRTDQFAFCAALWEALHDRHPFAGTTFAELHAHVTRGQRVAPPADTRVPAWLRRVLERGLAVVPDDRWPTTEALLAALQADPTRRRRRLAGLALAGLALGAWLGGQRHAEARQHAACLADGASIAAVWNDASRSQLRAGLIATGSSDAADRIDAAFAAHTAAWSEARSQACLAHAAARWDDDTRDRALWCLDERRMQLAALVDAFAAADAARVHDAVVAAATLAPVAPCLDVHHLRAAPPLPPDRPAVQSIQRALSQASAAQLAGHADASLTMAGQALAAAETLAWPPLVAAAHLQLGELHARAARNPAAEASLEAAYFQAARAGAHEVAAHAALRLIDITGVAQAHFDEGLQWAQHADVALTWLGAADDSPGRATALGHLALIHESRGTYEQARMLQARAVEIFHAALGEAHPTHAGALSNLSRIHYMLGNHREAEAIERRALALLEAALGPSHPLVALSLNNLAASRSVAGDLAAARALFERALAIQEAALGAHHTDTAVTASNLAVTLHNAGQYDAALPLYERSLAASRELLGPEHRDVATALHNLAVLHATAGRPEQARALDEQALEIWQTALGPDHPGVADALNSLAALDLAADAPERARPLAERSLAIRERALGPDHPAVAWSLHTLADVHRAAGALADARRLDERALEIFVRAHGREHASTAMALDGLARVALAQRRGADAVALAERSVGVREAEAGAPHRLADSRLLLAQALLSAADPAARDRAVTLAEQARDVFRAAPARPRQLAAAETLLRTLRPDHAAHAPGDRSDRSRQSERGEHRP